MEPLVVNDHEEMSRVAADIMASEIEAKPSALFCLATGATPLRAYESLTAKPRELFSALRVIKLDEWGGIPMSSSASCETFLRRSIITPLSLESRYIGFESQPDDFRADCIRVASLLRHHGPIDVCVLGLGINGHLGFNEPARALKPHAHVATLSRESLQHSMLASEPIKPSCGLTLGMADLLQSKKILLLVSGAAKREPIGRLMSGEITPEFPATFLLLHPNVTVICDRAAFGFPS